MANRPRLVRKNHCPIIRTSLQSTRTFCIGISDANANAAPGLENLIGDVGFFAAVVSRDSEHTESFEVLRFQLGEHFEESSDAGSTTFVVRHANLVSEATVNSAHRTPSLLTMLPPASREKKTIDVTMSKGDRSRTFDVETASIVRDSLSNE